MTHPNPLQVFRGIFFSISNIYGCSNMASVTIAWAAVFIASPLLFLQCLLGSCVGTGIAMVLGVSTTELATGVWSFNSLLVCGSVGGFFYVWNPILCFISIFAGTVDILSLYTCIHKVVYTGNSVLCKPDRLRTLTNPQPIRNEHRTVLSLACFP